MTSKTPKANDIDPLSEVSIIPVGIAMPEANNAPTERTVVFAEEVTTQSGISLINQLISLDLESKEPITLWLSTPGGHAHMGLSIYDIMRSLRSPIKVVCFGMVASAGVPIMLGGKERVATKNTRFFYHEPVAGSISFTSQQAHDFTENYKIVLDAMNKIIRGRTKIPAKFWRENFANSASYTFGIEEALEWKFIHSVIEKSTETI